MNMRAALEAILFVAEAPVPVEELAEVLEVPRIQVEAELTALAAEYAERGSGLVVRRAGNGWRFYTDPDSYPYLERYTETATARRLSGPALETLAVVAYRQPVSRSQIAQIRGVDAESAIRSLERWGLIEEAARLSSPGNPAVYRTTGLFLEKLGINDLAELPPLADHVPPASVMDAFEETFGPNR